ncbi:MAG: amidohydrolase, partial [Pseudomonadota bacterium]
MMSVIKRALPLLTPLALLLGCNQSPAPDPLDGVTLYVAKDILTLDKSQPRAQAVAVHEGKILEAGEAQTLQQRYQEMPGFTLDDRFAGQILTPGFVDPHLHLWLSTLLISQEFITPADWQLPWGDA